MVELLKILTPVELHLLVVMKNVADNNNTLVKTLEELTVLNKSSEGAVQRAIGILVNKSLIKKERIISANGHSPCIRYTITCNVENSPLFPDLTRAENAVLIGLKTLANDNGIIDDSCTKIAYTGQMLISDKCLLDYSSRLVEKGYLERLIVKTRRKSSNITVLSIVDSKYNNTNH